MGVALSLSSGLHPQANSQAWEASRLRPGGHPLLYGHPRSVGGVCTQLALKLCHRDVSIQVCARTFVSCPSALVGPLLQSTLPEDVGAGLGNASSLRGPLPHPGQQTAGPTRIRSVIGCGSRRRTCRSWWSHESWRWDLWGLFPSREWSALRWCDYASHSPCVSTRPSTSQRSSRCTRACWLQRNHHYRHRSSSRGTRHSRSHDCSAPADEGESFNTSWTLSDTTPRKDCWLPLGKSWTPAWGNRPLRGVSCHSCKPVPLPPFPLLVSLPASTHRHKQRWSNTTASHE